MAKKFSDIVANIPAYCEIRYANTIYDETKTIEYTGEPLLKRASIVLAVGKPGWGFGEFTFIQDENGKLFLDTECSKVDTVIEALTEWIKGAITDHDQNPENHKRYNEVRGSICGEHCKICHE